LAFIVANSLITNNLEEKTYENAMLRTLGWDKSNIVLVTLIKSTLYFIIPGFLIAITLLYGATFVIKDVIQNLLKRQIILDFNFMPVLIGLLVAYALPIISMIKPVINSLAMELRDALDIFRKKSSTVDVQFTKL
jgi:ABC-type antimicrobial peptide transport system permease subunit